jgi:two-component system sensor kinase FixL
MINGKAEINGNHFLSLRRKAERLLTEGSSYGQKCFFKKTIKIIEELNIHLIEKEEKNKEMMIIENELRGLKERYADLYEFSPIGYFSLNKKNKILEVNLTGASLLEMERSKIINKNFIDFIPSDFQDEFKHLRQQISETRCKQVCELQLLNRKKIPFYIRLESMLVNGYSEMDEQIHLSVFNINAQKQVEARFKESEEKFKSIVEATNDWIWCCDLQGNYTYCNPYIESLLGYAPNEIVGRNLFLFLSSQDFIRLKKQWTSLITRKLEWKHLILQYRCKNGTYAYLESTAVPMLDANRNIIGLLGVDRDITERKKAEAQLRQHQFLLAQSARINSMGEIASILAHEINQPLTAIAVFAASCTQLIISGNYQHERLLKITQKIEEQAERAGAIIHRMKSFLRNGILQLEITDINKLIKRLEDLCISIFPHDKLSLKLVLDKALPNIKVDKIQLEQVILNLLRNSMEAMQQDQIQDPTIVIQTKLLKNKIWISIKDNGPGFKNAELSRLFDTYYTTKQGGIGIGLSICRTIIEAHGGKLLAKPLSSGGACVNFFLPISGC